MKVAVVKYNAGNIRSVDYALKRLGVEAVITADKEILQSADPSSLAASAASYCSRVMMEMHYLLFFRIYRECCLCV